MTRPILISSVVVIALAGLAFCQSESRGSPPGISAEQLQPGTPYVEDGVIVVPEAFASVVGLEFTEVTTAALEPVIEVVGTVGFDEKKVAAVGSRIAGRVHEVAVSEGDFVKAGDILGQLESAELGTAQAGVYGAQAKYEAAAAQEQRRKNLEAEGVSSKRMVEESVAEAAIAKAELMAARQRVAALGDSRSGKLGVAAIRTPIDGQVITVHVHRGEAVAMSDDMFTIADLSTVWVHLAVFEDDLGGLSEGDAVTLRTTTTEVEMTGQIARVGAIIDPESRSARVRVIVDNADGALRIGQSISARINSKRASKQALSVPREAVVRVDGEPTVFVELGDGRVAVRRVELGASSGELQEIVSGLEPGERVATAGVFALKSELFR
jgi:cobalt-zinc-cadmium efflux system membrane fusion protein